MGPKTGPISYIKPHVVPSSNGILLGEEWVSGSVCVQWDRGRGGCSPNFTGPGPTPLKCSQPVKALLSRLKSIASQSMPLGWETLRSSPNKSYWHNMVNSQHLEHSLTLQSDHSNMQSCEFLGPIPLKDLYLPSRPPSFLPLSCIAVLSHKRVLRFRRLVASTLNLPDTRSQTLLQALQPLHIP